MEYEFSVGTFFFGILILIAGILLVRFHMWVADNFAGGVSSYDRVKLFGVIACGLGLIVMVNLHTLILGALVRMIFPTL
ncbi:MAG: hypothetical protein WBK76_04160 [Candidatus Saccharimonadales bacterium]